MFKNYILFIYFLFSTASLFAQKCFTEEYTQRLIFENPHLQEAITAAESETQYFLKYNQSETQKSGSSGIFRIPVVVHLIGNSVNIKFSANFNQKIIDQINTLNKDYRKIPGSIGYGEGVDTEIEFCLATEDHLGYPTSGVTYTPGNYAPWDFSTSANPSNSDYTLKHLIHWNPDEYLNIYVVDEINDLQGFSSKPTALYSFPDLDGVVIDDDYFGWNERTLTHEVGHWLGLSHTFGWITIGSGPYGFHGDCSVDDGIDDTPVCDDAFFSTFIDGCPAPNQCTVENQSNFSTDRRQIENYMDYSDNLCVNMFTQGQKELMHATLFAQRPFIWNTQQASCTTPSHCNNGIQDAGENDVDCGGDCKPCFYVPPPYGGGYPTCFSRLQQDGFYINNSLDLVKEVCLPSIIISSIPAPNPYCYNGFNVSAGNKLFVSVTLCNSNLVPIDQEYTKWISMPGYYSITSSFDLLSYYTTPWGFIVYPNLPSQYIHFYPGQTYRIKIATARWSWQEYTKYIRIYDNNNRFIQNKEINSSIYGGNQVTIQNSTMIPTPVTQVTFVHTIEAVAKQSISILPNTTLYSGSLLRIDANLTLISPSTPTPTKVNLLLN
ncbi:MAG: hypothetical protein HYU68_05690 [Bacteroidetes bacterium]|nr:hypothetical protein [Bacteroidota bacterium]